MRILTNPLLDCWTGPLRPDGSPRPFMALANVGLFFAVGTPPLVPDVLLSLDVEHLGDPFPKAGRSYFTWIYGKPPNVVVEIVSNREGGELTAKLRGYERIGIPYYVVTDPELHLSGQELHSFELVGGQYVERDSLRFESYGLCLVPWEGVFERLHSRWLRWATLEGALVPTAAEERQRAESEKQRAESEKQRAESEKQRAESEKQRAESEKQRADALAARLRTLGISLDDL
jgi:hypothetical protein